MADSTSFRILEEGWRNAIVEFTGILDTNDINLVPALNLSQFNNNHDRAGTLVGLRFDWAHWAISDGIELQMYWNATTPQLILPFAGRSHVCLTDRGGKVPDTGTSGYDGAINLISTGMASVNASNGGTQVYSLTIDFIKMYA